jgi:hypothetical protein
LHYFFLEPELRGKRQDTYISNAGFQLTQTSENEKWGVPVIEERWDLELK